MSLTGLNGINDIKVYDSFGNLPLFDWWFHEIVTPQVWEKTKGEGATIATIDTGVDHKHITFKSSFNMIDRDMNIKDEYGHGSHVAGLLTGALTGVAPNAELHVIKVLNEKGRGRIADVMDGITHAMNMKVDVLAISLGVRDIPLILKQRIVQAYESGMTIVSAVGNDSNPTPLYPAIMNEVIAVGGLDKDGNVAYFSNGGYDVLAPSVDILSTWKEDKYARLTGTSMASPLVAGAIALLISYYRKQGKELTPSEIKDMIHGYKLDLTKLIK